jgi:hypothetical protein
MSFKPRLQVCEWPDMVANEFLPAEYPYPFAVDLFGSGFVGLGYPRQTPSSSARTILDNGSAVKYYFIICLPIMCYAISQIYFLHA